jgi:hypothetical protein
MDDLFYWLREDHTVEAVPDLVTVGKRLADKVEGWLYFRVAATDVTEDVWVSTTFLPISLSFGGRPPLHFETMVFGPYGTGEQRRYATWDEAAAGHAEVVENLRATMRENVA